MVPKVSVEMGSRMRRGSRRMRRASGGSSQHGLAWIVVLAALAVFSAAGSAVAQRWSDQVARQKEELLLRVGNAYAHALASYRSASPGAERRYPSTLDQLVGDSRFVETRRHLRKLYADPLTGKVDWVLLRDARGDIVGLHSRSTEVPWKRTAVRLDDVDLPAAARYSEWIFTPRSTP